MTPADMFDTIQRVALSDVALAFAGMALLMLLVWLVLVLMEVRPAPDTDDLSGPVARMQKTLGVEGLPSWVFVLAAAIWLAILASLLAGLLMLIWTVILHAVPAAAPPPGTAAAPFDPARSAVWDYRFLLAQLAAITTVLGAVVAFPVTLSRLRLASEDKNTRAAALYNDKVNAALADLHAQRQVTEWKRKQGHIAVWQDDIVRRNGAIDRLESLAREEPGEAPRIARMLATYLRELSEVCPPKDPPPGATPDELQAWTRGLTRARSDMENAAQTLGRLRDLTGHTPETLPIDLHGANLQGMDLQRAGLERADLSRARMEGADLRGARMEGALLREARMEGADLRGARMQGANLVAAQMEGVFLDDALLDGANLRFASLKGADLMRALLHDADLTGVEMEGAKLREARLERANLSAASFDPSTDFSDADTTRAALKSLGLPNTAFDNDQLRSLFGDGSVTLRDSRRPAHWPGADLDWTDFDKEWRRWQADPAAYTRPEDRSA